MNTKTIQLIAAREPMLLHIADPMWRGTLTITARVGSETLTAHIIYIGVHHVESSSQTAGVGDTVTFTAFPDPQNESFPLDVTGDSAVRWTSQPDLGAPTVTVYGDRVEASYIIPEGVSGSGGSGGGGLTFVDATAKAEVAADSAFDAGSGDFSVVTFFKSSVPPPDHHVVFSNQNAQHPSTLELYVDINAADMRVAAGNPMSYQVFNHGGAPFDGQWHSVIITRQNGLLTAYYDGVNVGSGMAGGDGQHGQLSFGHLWGENHAQTLIGSLKNYSYWNRALSAQEVAAIASSGGQLAGNESGLVAYWPMDDGSGATLREVVAGRDAVLSGNYQWQSGGAGNGLVEVTAVSGSSEGKAFVLVVDGTQWVITPQPAVVGQDDVLAMSATQDGVTGMGAWMTKADFDLLWEIFSMTLAQSDTVTARQMLSAMFDEPNLTPPPLVAQLVTEGLPLLRVTVTDWDWMAAVEELIINGQTVDTSGWYPEDWEELLTQPHVQEMVLVLTENQEVVVERTIRAVMSDTGAEWHGVNTGSVDVVFFPMQEIAEVFASVSSTLTHHNESGIRGSCDSYPEWTLAEATLWVVNVGRVLVKDWVTGQTAETVRNLETNQSGPVGVLTIGVGGHVTLQAFINPDNAPRWPQDKPYWENVDPPQNSTAIFSSSSGADLTRFGPQSEEGDYTVHVSSSSHLSLVIRAIRLGFLRVDSNNDRLHNEQDEAVGVKTVWPGFVFWVKDGGANQPRIRKVNDLEDFAPMRLLVATPAVGTTYQLRWSPVNQQNTPTSSFGVSVYRRVHQNYLSVEVHAVAQVREPHLGVVRPGQPLTLPAELFTESRGAQRQANGEMEQWLVFAGTEPGEGLLELVLSDAQGTPLRNANGEDWVLDAVFLTLRHPHDLYLIGNARESLAAATDLLRFKHVRAAHKEPAGVLENVGTMYRTVPGRESVHGWIENTPTTTWGDPLNRYSDYKYPGNPYVPSTRFTEVRQHPNGPDLATVTTAVGMQVFGDRNPALWADPNTRTQLRNAHIIVGIHGFNIQEGYVGWFNTMYKRLYWAGWDGAFMGITWDGDTYKKTGNAIGNMVTSNVNYFNFDVENALRSGRVIADVIHNLKADGWHQVSIITHSLGATTAGQAMYDLATRERQPQIQRPWLHRVIHMQAAQGYDNYAPLAPGDDTEQAPDPEFFKTQFANGGSLHAIRQNPWRGIFRVALDAQAQVVAPNGIVNSYSENDTVLSGWFAISEGRKFWGLTTLISKDLARIWPQAIFREYSVYRELVWEARQQSAMGLGGLGQKPDKEIPGLPIGDNGNNFDAERVEDPDVPNTPIRRPPEFSHSYMMGKPYWEVGRVWRHIVRIRLGNQQQP